MDCGFLFPASKKKKSSECVYNIGHSPTNSLTRTLLFHICEAVHSHSIHILLTNPYLKFMNNEHNFYLFLCSVC